MNERIRKLANEARTYALTLEDREEDYVDDARFFRMEYNLNPKQDRHGYPTQAVYVGRVNDATGELE